MSEQPEQRSGENHLHTFCQLTSKSIGKIDKKINIETIYIAAKLKGKRDELLFNFRDKRAKRCPNSICPRHAMWQRGEGECHVDALNAAKHLNLTLLHLPMNMSTKSAEHTRISFDRA